MPTSVRQRRKGKGGSARRSRVEEEDYRPVGEDGSKPPLLDLHLIRKLKIMGLANILPLTIGTGLFVAWFMGSIEFSVSGSQLLFTVLIMLAALVLVGSSWWVLFPFSVWLRSYFKWYYYHESKIVYAAPLALSWAFWFGMWVSCIAMTLFAIWLIAQSVLKLIGLMDS